MRTGTVLLLAIASTALGEEFRVTPYTSPTELDCPWPRQSHYKQPWRGYIETKSGWDFVNGFGINLQIPSGTEEVAMRLLAETGFRACRIEVGFGEWNWDETKLNEEEKYRQRFALCAKYGLRPTILINAHHGIPCPSKTFTRRLVNDATKGSKTLLLDDVGELDGGRTGLNQLSDFWKAEVLFTSVNQETREVALSNGLPIDLKAGDLSISTLKYAPLHPVGTAEFEDTAAGLVGHTLRVCRLAQELGVHSFDVEIWNELTFGSHFLNINDYYDKASPKFPGQQPDPFRTGGRCWELARRIAEAVKMEFAEARCIWGFSNTAFYHTPIDKLPPGIDAQSYHPYGTGTRRFNGDSPRAAQSSLEGFVPKYEIRMPEGIMQTFIQTECLMRHLNPLERLTKKPPGTGRFRHYMTEHGVLAEECGIQDAAEAWKLKTLCATRSFCLWLNKGIDVLHYFNAYEPDPRSFGLLPADLGTLSRNARFNDVATPPMRALANLVGAFRGSIYLQKTTAVQVDVVALGAQRTVFEGDEMHPPLWEREVVAVLPFQVDAGKHVLAVYVMSRDATRSLPPERYRLIIRGAAGREIACYDPLLGKSVTVEPGTISDEAIEVTVPLLDYPRLLILSK